MSRLIIMAGQIAHTNYTLDANCQGAWLFASGAELIDSSGEGNTMTNMGTTTFAATLPTGYTSGQSALFDGTSQYLTRSLANLSANFPGKAQKTDFAVALWFKRTATGATQRILFSQSYGDSWYVAIDSEMLGFMTMDSDAQSDGEYPVSVEDTNWHHIVFSFDGGAPNSTVRYWFDGGAGVNMTFTAVNNVRAPGWGNGTIGSTTGGDAKFNGRIYQPIIFDRTLSDAEALEIYSYGINGAH